MPSKTRSRGAHAARAGWRQHRAILSLAAVAAVVAAGGTTALVVTNGPIASSSSLAPSHSATRSGTPTDSSSGAPSVADSPTATPTGSKQSTPTPTGQSTSTRAPTATPRGVTIKGLKPTGKSGQAKATIGYRASEGGTAEIECRVGSVTGPACQGSPWTVRPTAGSRTVKVGGLPDGTRTTLYFFQSSGGAHGPASSDHVVPYGPIGKVKFTKASASGRTIHFAVKVQPRGRPVHVIVTDSAGHRWTSKTGSATWSGGSSFTEPTWNTTYGLTLTVTDASGAGRKSVTVSKSRYVRWLKTYTVSDPSHPATCAVASVDPTWYGKSSCPGSLISNGSAVQVTCAVKGPAYYTNGKNHGPTGSEWYWYFELADGTYIHAVATQEATVDGADGNPTC